MMITKALRGLVIVFILCGCNISYNNKFEFNTDEVWISTDPSVLFYGWNEEKQASYGIIETKDGDIEICMLFNNSDKIVCERYYSVSRGEQNMPSDVIFRGTYNVKNSQLEIKNIKYEQNILDENVEELLFSKRNVDEYIVEEVK